MARRISMAALKSQGAYGVSAGYSNRVRLSLIIARAVFLTQYAATYSANMYEI